MLGEPLETASLDALLRDAKFSIPSPREGAVSRAALIDTARTSGRRVVSISAPAGYGKSTLLAEWARVEDRQVAWVSLSHFDDDPARLLALLASAYARVSPGNDELVADVAGVGVSVLGRAAPRLASVFRASPDPFVLMVDDVHELRSLECHDVLSVVIEGIPQGSQLVTASRAEQPHVPQLRASGDAIEILAGDLALDASGAEQIFSQVRVALTREAANEVTLRTEGWPVGLHLAALIARDSRGDGPMIAGDDRYVADYLYHEALMQLPDDDQRFLQRTAVVDQLCAPLCDTVVGEPGSQQRLRRLEASNLFLIPLDRRRQWYRYHGLFREFLVGELHRVEPDEVAKLHLRAADWYEGNGSPAMAVEHLLHTSERHRCVQVVTTLFLPTLFAGHITTIQRWLSSLGDRAIEEYPPLAVLATWSAIYTGQVAAAQRWAAFVDNASFDLVPLDGSASFDSARGMLRAAMCPAGPERMVADARIAVAQEAPWSPYRDTALNMCAEAHLLSGDVDQALALFGEGGAVAEQLDNSEPRIFSAVELAFLAMEHGRWDEVAERTAVALTLVERHRMYDYPTCALVFAAAARLAVHRGDLGEAHRHLAAAMRVRPTLTFLLPFVAVRARLHLAKAYWVIGDQTAAHHLLREIDEILLLRPALGTLVDEVAELRRIATLAGSLGATGVTPLTPAELRLLPYLQTHLAAREIASRLFVSINTVNSQLGSIYRKFGVTSRHEAVEQATTLGMLGG